MITAYKDAILEIKLERCDPKGIFIHVDVFQWGKDKALHCLGALDQVVKELTYAKESALFAMIDTKDKKLQKFASLFGFFESEEVIETPKEVYNIWEYRWH